MSEQNEVAKELIMKHIFNRLWKKESFSPSFIIGIWINPYFIIRKGLIKGVRNISTYVKGGSLLDVGCGKGFLLHEINLSIS